MDTVEWGSVAPARRVLPGLTGQYARNGGYLLAGLGFLAFLGGELLPWVAVGLSAGAISGPVNGGDEGTSPSALSTSLSLGLERLNSIEALAYHLGWLVLLGLVGFVLFGRPVQRRAGTGAVIGVATGLIGVAIDVIRGAKYAFGDAALDQPNRLSVGVGSGAVLGFVGLALMIGAVLMNSQAGRPRRARATPGQPRLEVPFEGPGAPVDLTVTSAPSVDERYFAHPE